MFAIQDPVQAADVRTTGRGFALGIVSRRHAISRCLRRTDSERGESTLPCRSRHWLTYTIFAAQQGELAGVDSFHAHLPLRNMRCDLDRNRVAYYWHNKLALRLSGFAAETLIAEKYIERKSLEAHRESTLL